MSKISTAMLRGESGEQYRFEVYRYDTMFREGSKGVYLIARRYKLEGGQYTLDPIYIGESGDLSRLYGYHPRQQCIKKYFPNCTCVYSVKDEERRKYIVEDLVEYHEPHCNG